MIEEDSEFWKKGRDREKMTAAAESGRTLLVGVQIDGNGREVLDWALTRVARLGDSVIAVHVSQRDGGAAVPLSSLLAEYQDLANLKQVIINSFSLYLSLSLSLN